MWEVRLVTLSKELDMRTLPLKTLLVYLEMKGIIRFRDTHYDEYVFKFLIPQERIIEQFQGERRDFIKAIFNGCSTMKVWTYVRIDEILAAYEKSDRQRVIAALEHFAEQGWIVLQTRQMTETYEIVTRDFDWNVLGHRISDYFIKKEAVEIQRIHDVVSFMESDVCLSKRLAGYFGEQIQKERCGHCSLCMSGKAEIRRTLNLESLRAYNLSDLTREFETSIGDKKSTVKTSKFLCGISTPLFTTLKIPALQNFGVLEDYPF